MGKGLYLELVDDDPVLTFPDFDVITMSPQAIEPKAGILFNESMSRSTFSLLSCPKIFKTIKKCIVLKKVYTFWLIILLQVYTFFLILNSLYIC
jgi:hypothetical protein